MLRQRIKKQDTHVSMGKYDPKSAQAWAVIMNKISSLRKKGMTLETIGKQLNVTRATVSRWFNEEIGGEKTTFGDMLRYADALGIPYSSLLQQGELTADAEKKQASPYAKAAGTVLSGFASEDKMTVTDIANEAGLPALVVNETLTGTHEPTIEQFHKICQAVGVKDTIILGRTDALVKEEEQKAKDATADAERTA